MGLCSGFYDPLLTFLTRYDLFGGQRINISISQSRIAAKQEDNRMGSNSVVSERALREVYLKGFEIAIRQAQPISIMTSYNLINGVHAANNYDLCTESARN